MIRNTTKGIFLMLEGIDGCGKTTQLELLHARLGNDDRIFITKEPTPDRLFGAFVRFLYTESSRKPTELAGYLTAFLANSDYCLARERIASDRPAIHGYFNEFEEFARRVANGSTAELPALLQMGMVFDRYEHYVLDLIPRLERGIAVIQDRGFPSTFAYAAAEGLSWERFLRMQEVLFGERQFLAPNLLFYLDLPAELALQRLQAGRGGRPERFDTLEFLEKVSQAYQSILQDERLCSVMTMVELDGRTSPDLIHEEIWTQVQPLLLDQPT